MNNEQLLESLLSDPEIIKLLTTLKDNANDNARYNKIEDERSSYYDRPRPCHHDPCKCHHECRCNDDNGFDFIIIIIILFFFCGGFGFGGFFC